jgi:hypothetical protein
MQLSSAIKWFALVAAAAVSIAFLTMVLKPADIRACFWSDRLNSCAWAQQ